MTRPPCSNVPPCGEEPCARCKRVMKAMEGLNRELEAFADANVIGRMTVSEQTRASVLASMQRIDPSIVAAEYDFDGEDGVAINLIRRDFSNAVRIAEES